MSLSAFKTRITAEVQVGGKKKSAVIDTGTSNSFVSVQLAKTLLTGSKMNFYKSVNLADGSSRIINESLIVDISLGLKSCEQRLIVLPGMKDDLILGMDFLRDSNAAIQLGGETLKIKSGPEIEESTINTNNKNQWSGQESPTQLHEYDHISISDDDEEQQSMDDDNADNKVTESSLLLSRDVDEDIVDAIQEFFKNKMTVYGNGVLVKNPANQLQQARQRLANEHLKMHSSDISDEDCTIISDDTPKLSDFSTKINNTQCSTYLMLNKQELHVNVNKITMCSQIEEKCPPAPTMCIPKSNKNSDHEDECPPAPKMKIDKPNIKTTKIKGKRNRKWKDRHCTMLQEAQRPRGHFTIQPMSDIYLNNPNWMQFNMKNHLLDRIINLTGKPYLPIEVVKDVSAILNKKFSLRRQLYFKRNYVNEIYNININCEGYALITKRRPRYFDSKCVKSLK